MNSFISYTKAHALMIGERFLHHLKNVPPRNLPRLQLFTRFVHRRIADATNRASYTTPNGYGSRLLVQIIKLADLRIILTAGFQEKLGDYLLDILKDLEKPIDPRIGRITASSLFIKSRTPCYEIVTPSRRASPLSDIPYDQPWLFDGWKTIQPLRVNDMGIAGLKYQVYGETLTYNGQGPTHAVYSLDCFALVAKFVAYYHAQTSVENIDQCLLDFVHNEVIIPTLLNDGFALWMRNTYYQQFLTVSPLEMHVSTIWDVVTPDSLGSDFYPALEDIGHLRDDLMQRAISDHQVFCSLPLSTTGESFNDYYKTLYTTTTTPDQQPYMWVDCLKNLSWWSFILTIGSMAPGYPDIISLKRAALRDVRFWVNNKPWQQIHGSLPYQSMIRSKLEGLYFYLKDGR